MYTIKQAAARSGVGASLIRAWERRYGVVSPRRTEAGYRLYDDRAVAILQAMRALISSGWTASQAARGIVAGEIPVDEWAARQLADRPRGGPRGASQDTLDPIGAFVRGAAAYDVWAVEAALDELFGRGSFEAIVDDFVLPAAAALGDSWAEGRLDVGSEHLGSAAIARRLAGAFEAAARIPSGPPVVIGLPPGARHELGALAFAVVLRRHGFQAVYLGADVPLSSWVDAVRAGNAAAAVLAVVSGADVPAAEEIWRTLQSTHPSLIVAVGGKAAADLSGTRSERSPVVLPQRVTDAADALAEAIGNAAVRVDRDSSARRVVV